VQPIASIAMRGKALCHLELESLSFWGHRGQWRTEMTGGIGEALVEGCRVQ
jgi:hypothetical protein